MVGQWISQIQEQREALRWLTTFAIASRYPVETVEVVDEPQGRRSLDIAQAIRRACRAYLMALEPTLFDL
jgi:HEPN domain-containing protein